ncbi:RES domain-containing protein [Klebsiella pneumoniae]|uniref:RES domain-containing protein n=1 Tax=Klebsiella pneumoniae TaxID=573 RepID=UPI00136C9276|nr:RES domain-containing protein [Klebsiella pneumoniae]MCY0362562.1 RES domain-containing protein [Klebsiella pneumoniae]MDE1651715.1 RES domain-containing protein [Klebsiella pneumoniae]MDG5625977.1 RES domain-containing protein [Klebsiella pneumoniae]MZX79599.1 RES domain-containing protein [Klebsiella pneumoniae]HBR7470229.1 RES domain-containing protein [Klebsiella pneumoniae]
MTLKTIIEQFPPLSVDELVTGINNFPQYNIAMKKEFLAKLIKHHPLLYVDWGEGSSYYRARYMGNDASPIDHVSKILCPPKEIRSYGRIDSDENEILYTASSKNTALNELKNYNNSFNYYTIATFRIYNSIKVLPIGELSHTQVTGRGMLLGNQSQSINKLINACNPDEVTRLLITDKFLSDSLMSDNYNITSYVANCIFEKNSDIYVIAYPSKQYPGGINFAIKNKVIWNHLGINAVRYAQIRHLACGYFEERNTRHVKGITQRGKLIWDENHADDEYYTYPLEPLWTPGQSI